MMKEEGKKTKTRAAQYVRMSTDHQRYSTENQAEIIEAYAARRNFEIVRTYADEGRSGLSIAGRDSLKRLIDDVQQGRADSEAILVYDISRWGRFQDADESAYYEFICRERGINIQVISTSEIKISVLIDAAYAELAVRALHSAYGLEAV